MSASVIGAIASSATTAILGLIALWARKIAKNIGNHRREHEFLIRTTTYNAIAIRRILTHLEIKE